KVAPTGGDYINLLPDYDDCSLNPSTQLKLHWRVPADDDTIRFSGRAVSYELRRTLNSSPASDWSGWAPITAPSPGHVGNLDQTVLSGLSSSVWYRFALKTLDDGGNSSGLSNVLIAHPDACNGGGDDGGDGGIILHATAPGIPSGAPRYSVRPTGATGGPA